MNFNVILLVLLVSNNLYFVAGQCSCSDSNGLGSSPVPSSGFCFRVWAPHPSSGVLIPKGSSSWNNSTMVKNGEVFSTCISTAQIGDGYLYYFDYNGTQFTRLDPYSQDLVLSGDVNSPNFSYSRIHNPNFTWAATPVGFPVSIERAIIYEMFLPAYGGHEWTNVSSTEPSTPFYVAASKLDHFVSLGITHIELMPTGTFCGIPDELGYTPCAIMTPMVAWGGYIGLKYFVNLANQKGIAVIMDVVFNHMSVINNVQTILNDYDGFTGDSESEFGGTGIMLNGTYFYETPIIESKYKSGYAPSPWGPRPKYNEVYVAQWITDVVTTLISDYHISGFRFDSTGCIHSNCSKPDNNAGWQLLQNLTTKLNQMVSPSTNLILVAEDNSLFVTQSVDNTSFCSLGGPNCTDIECTPDGISVCGGLGFSAQWYGSFFPTILSQLIGNDISLNKLPGNIEPNISIIAQTLLDCTTMGGRVVFVENHDASEPPKYFGLLGAWGRMAADASESIPSNSVHNLTWWTYRKSQLAVSLMCVASCGIPMIFQGQEFMQYVYVFDSNLLTSGNSTSFMQAFIDIFAIRKSEPSLFFNASSGNIIQTNDQYKIAVIQKSNLLIIINVGNQDFVGWKLENLEYSNIFYDVIFSGDNFLYGCQSSITQNCTQKTSMYTSFGLNQQVQIINGIGTVNVPMWSVLILKVSTNKVNPSNNANPSNNVNPSNNPSNSVINNPNPIYHHIFAYLLVLAYALAII